MDLVSFLMIFMTSAALTLHDGAARNEEIVPVVCGQPFNLSCILNNSAECTWNRHGTFVKSENTNRYLFRNETMYNGSTKCEFHCIEADVKIDGGQWTCGTPANDQQDGIVSKYISVNVLAEYGTICNPITTTRRSASIPDVDDVDPIVLSDSTWIMIVVALSSVVLILISATIIWICMKRKRQRLAPEVKTMDKKENSIHEYEEIDEASGYSQRAPPLKTTPAGRLPAKCFHDDNVAVPISDRNSSLNHTDSDFVFKLIAVRKPKDENSIDLANGIELASFNNHSVNPSATHPYQNIRYATQYN